MAKRVLSTSTLGNTASEWLRAQIKAWAQRSVELSDEIALLNFNYSKWKLEYEQKNNHREDWMADDEWTTGHLEHLNELWQLDDEMNYLRMCLEDEIIHCPL